MDLEEARRAEEDAEEARQHHAGAEEVAQVAPFGQRTTASTIKSTASAISISTQTTSHP